MRRWLLVAILAAACGPAPLVSGTITAKTDYPAYDTIDHWCISYSKSGWCQVTIPITTHHDERWTLTIHGCDKAGCRDTVVDVSQTEFERDQIGQDWEKPGS